MIRSRTLGRSRVCGSALAVMIMLSVASGSAEPAGAQSQDPRSRLVALAEAGRWNEVLPIALALRDKAPRDVTVLIVLSRALRASGDPEGAREAAQSANAIADEDDERYAAATELAAAAYAMERFMTAQFWLRRAVQVAPTPVLRRSAIQNYRAVAFVNPWTLWLLFGITPSSNVNNGSVSETLEIGDIDFVLNPDAQALSGIESTIGLSLGYRLTGLGGLPARLGLSATLQDISLSPDARDAAPDIDGDAFDYAGVELRLDQALSRAEAPLRFRVDARLGRTWYGGSEYASYVRAGVGADWGDPVERITSVTLSAERQERLNLDSRSATILRLEAVKGWRLPSGDDVLVAGTLRFTSSDSIEIDHDAALASVTYDFGTVAGGQLALATSIGLEWRHYDDSPYRAGGRDDLRKRLSARVGFPRAETYGFIPEITFEASEVTSNVSLYESRDFGVRLGFRSSF